MQRAEYDVSEERDEMTPQSPRDSFNFSVISTEESRGEPPLLPTFLNIQTDDLVSERMPPSTAYVRVDHLFSSKLIYHSRKAQEDCNLVNLHGPGEDYTTLTQTRRYKSKLITTIMVAPPKRPYFSNSVNELVVGGFGQRVD